MNKKEKINLIILNGCFILALILVITPLLVISKYDRASADDWSFGVYGYTALKSGENFGTVIKMAFMKAYKKYFTWEGRFAAVFFASFQPGIFGEEYYVIVPWIMIGMLIFSHIFLCYSILDTDNKDNRKYCLMLIIPAIIIEILYTPSVTESFYWYVGSVNYTFVHGLSYILLGIFLKLAFKKYSKLKYIVISLISAIIAVFVGGNNFATSLYTVITLWVLSVLFFKTNKKTVKKIWFIPLISTICLLLCILAPANSQRVNANFNGKTGSALNAISMSLIRTLTNIGSWTNIKIVLMIILILPFVWKTVVGMNYKFKKPLLFTITTYGIYASQITATMYVDGTSGGGRMSAILYYSYVIWILLNVVYWIGWIAKKGWLDKHKEKIITLTEKYSMVYCAMVGILLIFIIYKFDLKDISSYKAYRDYRQGLAEQYAAEWDERYNVLHDDTVKDVVFQPLSVSPETLMYTDLQDEYGYVWVNSACAVYYGKDSITVTADDEK
jgi:hypothetical protein